MRWKKYPFNQPMWRTRFLPKSTSRLALLLTLCFAQHAMAQDIPAMLQLSTNSSSDIFSPPSSAETMSDKLTNQSYEQRIERIRQRWAKVIPKAQKIQFAGGIGLVSAGVSWDYGKSKQWETDLMLGYIPKYETHNGKFSLTLRQNYIPWQIACSMRNEIAPVTFSFAVNTVLSDEFWVSEPQRYPKGYYGFSSKIRFHLGVGQRFTHHINYNKRRLTRDVSFFYELSTCDLYVVSYFTNKSIKINDIFSLSLGLKLQIF